MNDTQILTIALASVPNVIAVLVGILINNSRLGDLKAEINARFGDTRTEINARLSDTKSEINARLGDNKAEINARFADMNTRFADMNTRLAETNSRIGDLRSHMDARFDDMRDTWRAEMHRVEEVIDARLKHLEER